MQCDEVTVEVISDASAWDAVASEWDAVYEQAEHAPPALDRFWLRSWWQVYGDACAAGRSALRIVVVRRGTRAIGFLPLYVRAGSAASFGARRLMLLSTGEPERDEVCPDYMDVLSASRDATACRDAVAAAIRAMPAADTRFVVLNAIPAESSLATIWNPATVAVTVRHAPCLVANLEGGFEQYVKRLPAHRRGRVRSILRHAERAGLTLDIATRDGEAAHAFDQLSALHEARWRRVGHAGCFASARFTRFHRAIAAEWVPKGRAVLASLMSGGVPIAVIYGFVSGRRFDFYQCGVAIDDPAVHSPGITANLALMRALADRGIDTYDFLRGSSEYKQHLATDVRHVMDVTALRRGFVTAADRATRAVARGTLSTRRAFAELRQRVTSHVNAT